MVIADGSAKVLKSYEEENLFISGIEIGENIITIRRVRYDGEKNEYKEADSDTILNNPEVKKKAKIPLSPRKVWLIARFRRSLAVVERGKRREPRKRRAALRVIASFVAGENAARKTT